MKGSYCGEKRKRGRPRRYGSCGSIEHTSSPSAIAESTPPGFFNPYQDASSKDTVFPVGNHTPPSTGLVSADGSQDNPPNSVGLENLGSVPAGGSQSKALHSSAVLENLGSVSAAGSQSKAPHSTVPENLASGAEHNLMGCSEPEVEYKINMEIEDTTATQAQRQMSRFSSTITELCSNFETTKKKNEELVKQVADLEGQIQKWKELKASWDDNKKELERERDEARRAALSAVCEKRDIETKLENAAKQADKAKACAKKAIDKVVTSTINYQTGLRNFVAYLANSEGKLLGDFVNDLVKEKL